MANKPLILMLNPRLPSYLSMLDEATIGKICDYLSLYELLVIADMDINYQRLIGERIIAKTSLDISSISAHFDVRRAFRLFGEFTTNLIVCESDIQYKDEQCTLIEEIFRLITKRCVAGRLKSVSIVTNKDKKEKRSITEIPDVFEHVESLILDLIGGKFDFVDKFMPKLLSKCQNLRLLRTTLNISENTSSLLLPKLKNLESLNLNNCHIPWTMWKGFINAGARPLKWLELDQCQFFSKTQTNVSIFFEEIVAAFPFIEAFTYYRCRFRNIDIKKSSIRPFMKWPKLIEFGFDLREQYDLDVFSVLATENTVEHLFLFNLGKCLPSPSIKNLTKLRTVLFDRTCKDHIPFIQEFLRLPLLVTWTFQEFVDEVIISAIVSGSVNLKILEFESYSREFLLSLATLRQTMFPFSSPVNLRVPYEMVMPTSSKIIFSHFKY